MVVARQLADWRRAPEETIDGALKPAASMEQTRSEQPPATQLRRALKEELSTLIDRGDPIHVGLSGGVDSSSLVAAIVDLGHRPVVWLLDDQCQCDEERRHARSIIDRFELAAHFVAVDPASFPDYFQATVEHSGEAVINARAVAKFLFYRHVADAAPPVFVTGVGADDLFAGKPDRWSINNRGIPGFAVSSQASRDLVRGLLHEQFKVSETKLTTPVDIQTLLTMHMESVTRPLVLPMEVHLPAAMGISVAAPFMSPALIRLAKTLRREQLIGAGRGKLVLRQAVEPLVGRAVAWQPKTPVLAPVGGGTEAIRKKWADLFARLLTPSRLTPLGCVRVEPVEQLIDDYRRLPLSSKPMMAMERVLMHLASLTIMNRPVE